MTGVFVVGMSPLNLERVQTGLEKTGAETPLPVGQEATLGFHEWHRQAIPFLREARPVGRLLEHIAADLLIRNMDVPLWAWAIADEGRAVADFWAAHDPQLRFLLLYQSPLERLQQGVLQGQTDAVRLIADWQVEQRLKRDFYLDHPDRSLLVHEGDFISAPGSVLRRISRQATTTHDGTSDEITDRGEEALIKRFVVAQLVRSLPAGAAEDAQSLFEELEAANPVALHRSELSAESVAYRSEWTHCDISLAAVVEEHQQLCVGFDDVCRRLKTAHGKAEDALTQLQEAQERLRRERQQRTQEKTDRDQMALRIQQLERDLKTSDDVQQRIREDNEAMLLEVDRVQQQLEAEVAAHQRTRDERYAVTARLTRSVQTHGVGAWAVQVSAGQEQSDNADLDWHLQDVLIGDRLNEDMAITLRETNGRVTLAFPESVIRQKAVIPADVDTMATLTTSEYDCVTQCLRVLVELLPRSTLRSSVVRRWSKLLKQTVEKVDASEPTLRFDAVRLRNIQVNGDYEHLWLVLENPSFADRRPGEWSFRISCAAVAPGQFGRQPKLEVPKQSLEMLANWFAESQDDWSGEKFELRFALPDDMDKSVWKQMDSSDQSLLSGLIQKLPAMIERLENSGADMSRPWQDWRRLVADMGDIHGRKTR